MEKQKISRKNTATSRRERENNRRGNRGKPKDMENGSKNSEENKKRNSRKRNRRRKEHLKTEEDELLEYNLIIIKSKVLKKIRGYSKHKRPLRKGIAQKAH